ncbi:hypothetical protein GCM10011491_06960 [Brucella endophytica]|uniref:Uncharacterized protein n=1 Tax=Brucella endophytica TaxID=1963359 RepID=A0A916S5M4_9HYPH|nr:hypothetical protein [Brucella endophytica]GGA82161.1 hypothetical protein GCM10011491_06960 [Brucella endophytica]
MPKKQKITGIQSAHSKVEATSLLNMQALHQAAVRLADLKRGGSTLTTRDLVALLICHAARSRRASLPFAPVHLHTSDPRGMKAIRLRFH